MPVSRSFVTAATSGEHTTLFMHIYPEETVLSVLYRSHGYTARITLTEPLEGQISWLACAEIKVAPPEPICEICGKPLHVGIHGIRRDVDYYVCDTDDDDREFALDFFGE